MKIYTIGHSTLNIDDFLAILKEYKVKILVDVRSLPGSNHVPAFNQETFATTLEQNDIKYIHLKSLGGRRKSKNAKDFELVSGWKNISFRNYASYTLTNDYEEGIKTLSDIASDSTCCIMCAESVPWRCHRSIIANTLVHSGIKVIHIMGNNKTIEHRLNLYGAKTSIKNGRLIYPYKNINDH